MITCLKQRLSWFQLYCQIFSETVKGENAFLNIIKNYNKFIEDMESQAPGCRCFLKIAMPLVIVGGILYLVTFPLLLLVETFAAIAFLCFFSIILVPIGLIYPPLACCETRCQVCLIYLILWSVLGFVIQLLETA